MQSGLTLDLGLVCAVCEQWITHDGVISGILQGALFGWRPYAICPCCFQICENAETDEAYRRRCVTWVERNRPGLFEWLTNEATRSTAIKCQQCHRPFQRDAWAGTILGESHGDTWFLCPICNLYTVVTTWDTVTAKDNRSVSGPISKAEGDQRLALIRQCLEPTNKQCYCDAHLAYFNPFQADGSSSGSKGDCFVP